jgi:hypothetical protein
MFRDGGFIVFVGLFVVGKQWFTSSVLSSGISGGGTSELNQKNGGFYWF